MKKLPICPLTGKVCTEKKCIHITDIKDNGKIIELNLCNICGTSIHDECHNQVVVQMNKSNIPNPIKILLNILGMSNPEKEQKKNPEKIDQRTCPKCGLTLGELMQTARFGCDNCYIYYKDVILDILNQDKSNINLHIGKKPKSIQNNHEINKEEKLKCLKLKMAKYVELEKYEDANKIKEEIKKIEQ